MTPEERQAADQAAAERARVKRDARFTDRALSKLSPERREDAKLMKMIEQAVDARMARLVFQNGPGISITGGNGNYTIALDVSAVALSGNGVCNADGTSTFTFKLSL